MFNNVDTIPDLISEINRERHNSFGLSKEIVDNACKVLITRFENEIPTFFDKYSVTDIRKNHNDKLKFDIGIEIGNGKDPNDLLIGYLEDIDSIANRSYLGDWGSNNEVITVIDRMWYLSGYIDSIRPSDLKYFNKTLGKVIDLGLNQVKRKCIRYLKLISYNKLIGKEVAVDIFSNIINFQVFKFGQVNWEIMDEMIGSGIVNKFDLELKITEEQTRNLLYSIDWGITLENLEIIGEKNDRNPSSSPLFAKELQEILSHNLPKPPDVLGFFHKFIYFYISTKDVNRKVSTNVGIRLLRKYEKKYPGTIRLLFSDQEELEKLEYPVNHSIILQVYDSLFPKIYHSIWGNEKNGLPSLKELVKDVPNWNWGLMEILHLLVTMLSLVYSDYGDNSEWEGILQNNVITPLNKKYLSMSYPKVNNSSPPQNQRWFTYLNRMISTINQVEFRKDIYSNIQDLKSYFKEKYPDMNNFLKNNLSKANIGLWHYIENSFEFDQKYEQLGREDIRRQNLFDRMLIPGFYLSKLNLSLWDNLVKAYFVHSKNSVHDHFLKVLKSNDNRKFTDTTAEISFLSIFMANFGPLKNDFKLQIEADNPNIQNNNRYDFAFISLPDELTLLIEVYSPRDRTWYKNKKFRSGIKFDKIEENISLKSYIDKLFSKKLQQQDPKLPVILALNINHNLQGLQTEELMRIDFKSFQEKYPSIDFITGFLVMHSIKNLTHKIEYVENPIQKYQLSQELMDFIHRTVEYEGKGTFNLDLLLE